MRLTNEQRTAICDSFEKLFFEGDSLWLFGSRTDDSLRGGDIDLYIETNQENATLVYDRRFKLSSDIQRKIGEQKIDIVINMLALGKTLPIHEEAQKTGILLMKKKSKLQEYIQTADLHASRLQHAHKKVYKKYATIPGFLDNLTLEDIEPLDMMSTRYNKLQDLIGSKIFPIILEATGNDPLLFIDKLNRLEKLGFLDDANWWEDLRKLRNLTTHEYPDDDLALHSTITKVICESEKLLKYWNKLKPKLRPLTE